MANSTTALVFVLLANVFMFIAQASLLNLDSDTQIFNCQGSLVEAFDKNKCLSANYSLDDSGLTENFPATPSQVSQTSGNVFTDIFNSIKRFFSEKLGLKYVYGIVKAPYSLVGALNLDPLLTFIIGTFWYALTLFVIISYMWGRGD